MDSNNTLKPKLASEGKCKPRGRPFPKGHKLGKRFKPGESGNPDGSSKLQCLTAELRRQLPLAAEKIIAASIARAKKSGISPEVLWDRAEGPLLKSNDASGNGGMQVWIINQAYRPPRPATSIPPSQEGDQ
jgi:hypothetical protein